MPADTTTNVRCAGGSLGERGSTVTELTPASFSKHSRTVIWRPEQPVSPTVTRIVSPFNPLMPIRKAKNVGVRSIWRLQMAIGSGDDFLVEGLPIVEIVQIDGVEDFPFVRDAAGAEDRSADPVGVVVAGDGGVEFRDGGGIERAAGLGEDPCFAFGISRFAPGDEAFESAFIQAEAVEDHLVIALAARRIVRMKFAGRTERGFLPKARKVKDAEGACGAGADQGNEVGHSGWSIELRGDFLMKSPSNSSACPGGLQSLVWSKMNSRDFSRFIPAASVSNRLAAACCGNFIPSSHRYVERPLLPRHFVARPAIRRIHFV